MESLTLAHLPEKENNNETHAESIAQAKLERLLADDFSDFAIRFMNFSEYEELLQNKRFRGGNAYAPKNKTATSHPEPISFKEYLEKAKEKGWQWKIQDDVDWSQGAMSIDMYNELMKTLRAAKHSVNRETIGKEDYIPEILKEMRGRLNAEIQKERDYRDPHGVGTDIPFAQDSESFDYIEQKYDVFFFAFALPEIQQLINSKKENLKTLHGEEALTLSEEISEWATYIDEKTKELGGKENLDLVRKWFENPESVELRPFINAVASGQVSWNEERQYQVALVIDSKGFRKSERGTSNWGGIKIGGSLENILGAISLIPDKAWTQKITEQAKSSGDFSHPVFDNKGVVKFPKQKSE
jgi:hypothetical protein